MLDDILAQIEALGMNLYRITEIEHGTVRTVEFIPTCPCCDAYSVAKSFTMTAVGVLFDRGLLTPDTRAADVFADELAAYRAAGMVVDENWMHVTVDHLLRHRAGLPSGFLDIDVQDACAYPSRDFLALLFGQSLSPAPGEKYVYSDGAYYLLARIVEKLSGEGMDDLLCDALIEPFGVREVAWSKCPQHHVIGATGLYIRTADMAKLGQLYLDGGVWRGRRLLSCAWVELAMKREYALNRCANGAYAKGGMRGQRLYFNPSTGRVFAWHGHDKSGGSDALLRLIVEHDR